MLQLQAQLAARTAELDQLQKTLSDQEEAIDKLAARSSKRRALIGRYRRCLMLSACATGSALVVVVAQSLAGVVCAAAAVGLLAGACVPRWLHGRRRAANVSAAGRTRLAPESRVDHFDARTDAELQRAVRRLATYRAFSCGAGGHDFAHGRLVLAAAHENGGYVTSYAECRDICHARWGLELEMDEISFAMKQLVADGQVLEEPKRFRLSASCSEAVARRVRASNELEAAAFSEWEAAVRSTMPWVDDRRLTELRDDLASWVGRIVMELGIEAALVPDSGRDRDRSHIRTIQEMGFASLPPRDPRTMLDRPVVLSVFLEQMTATQRRYFETLAATAHFVSTLTLEPAKLAETHELLSGRRLYLDTNVVYSLLKLNGPEQYVGTKRVLELSRGLGYQVCVTPWTVIETQAAVRDAHARVSRVSSSRERSAGRSRSFLQDGDTAQIQRAFRSMQRATGIGPSDFFDLHEQVRLLLEHEGVEVIEDGCSEIDADGAMIEDAVVALVRFVEAKPRGVLEHDVKHRLLIERLRGDAPERHAASVLLTNDGSLVRYADVGRTSGSEVPFATSLKSWARVVRSLTPRTDDYEATIERVLDTPTLRSSTVRRADVVQALARIDACAKQPQTCATQALLDTALGGAEDGVDSVGAGARPPDFCG